MIWGQFTTKCSTFMPLLSLIVIFLMKASVFMQLCIHGLTLQNKSFLLTHLSFVSRSDRLLANTLHSDGTEV